MDAHNIDCAADILILCIFLTFVYDAIFEVCKNVSSAFKVSGANV